MNTTITVTSLSMPAAELGPMNPLPDLKTVQYVHSGVTVGPHMTEKEAKYIGYGMVQSILPYKIQDGYDRDRKLRSFRAVVLENDFLKAAFLPGLGGRLWSLYHKKAHRELLHVNPVFQPCHLALRNAWFSGGIEWNVGIKGHNPYTCDPLHAEIVENGRMSILRMYEYERIRRCVYCLEAYLPDDSEVLYVKTRIHNTSGKTVPMYWWSNIAVNETFDTRVIAPGESALECYYSGTSYQLDKVAMPVRNGTDVSFPTHLRSSRDYFYCVPENGRKWIFAVEKDGRGLFEASTANLNGKKVFQWGMTPGGRHWQEYLSQPGSSYVEIQSGLARTQLEHIPMEKDDTWEFVEAFGMVSTHPEAAFDPDYRRAQADAESSIFSVLQGRTPDVLQMDEGWRQLSEQRGQLIQNGSGWGALENLRRKQNGEPLLPVFCTFPESSLHTEQNDWVHLLQTGVFAPRPVQEEPTSYMADENWLDLLEKQDDWYGQLQYGVALYGLGCAAEAMSAFRRSCALQENGWACRNIAQLEKLLEHWDEAERWLARAVKLLSWNRHICGEYLDLLNNHGQSAKALACFATLPEAVRKHPRIVLQRIIALNRSGQPEEAQQLLESGLVLPDIREGEASLAAVWMEVQKNREAIGLEPKPLPYALDFRMH